MNCAAKEIHEMISKIPSLSDYGLSKSLGFLSDERPSESFSDDYYAPWDDLICKLPQLITSHKIREAVLQLPTLTADKLSGELDERRAYVGLAFTIHGYIWAGDKPTDIIPPQLSEPFLTVTQRLGIRPVLVYAGLCLWNWRCTADAHDGAFPDLESLASVCSFTGTRGEDAFYHVSVLNEATGGHLVQLLLDAIASPDVAFVTTALTTAADTISRMTKHLPKLYAVLGASEFYHRIRPFFGAGTTLAEAGYPLGVRFQRSDGSEQAVKYIGGTAGQSSLFQFIDLALGVRHKAEGPNETFFQVRTSPGGTR